MTSEPEFEIPDEATRPLGEPFHAASGGAFSDHAVRSADGRRSGLRLVTAITAILGWLVAAALLFSGVWKLGLALAMLASFLLGVMLLSAFLSARFLAITVRGRSMEPTYHDGDRVLVRRGVRPRRGEVVVIDYSADPDSPGGGRILPSLDMPVSSERARLIKRVVASPGDPIPRAGIPALAHTPEGLVPSGRLVLLGDNPNGSFDSRSVGFFSSSLVIGVVVRRLS